MVRGGRVDGLKSGGARGLVGAGGEGQIRDQTSRRLTHSQNLGARCRSKRKPLDYD